MKKLLIATAVAATFVAPQAFAQAKNFEGFSIGANVTGAKTTATATRLSAGGVNADDSANTTGVDLTADYTFALGQSFTLGVGITLGTSANKAGTIVSDITNKERVALDFTAGFAASDSMLIFGKVSALSSTGETVGAGGNATRSMSGLGYGIGLRALISKNVYLQAGYDVNTYDKTSFGATSLEFKTGVFSLGVGYKF